MSLYLLRLGLVTAVYFVAARGGLLLDAVSGVATTVWPPTGISLAALLVWGYRLWPGIALGAFLVNFSVGVSFLGALGISTGNTLEAFVGAALLNRFAGFRPSLERLRDVISLTVLASLLSTVVSATIGVTSGWLAGVIDAAHYGSAWRSWQVGDMLGDLVVAPFLLTWSARPRPGWRRGELAEGVVLLGLLACVGLGIFGGFFRTEPPDFVQPYFIFPLLIWAALRFGPRGVATANLVVSAIAISGTAQGYGLFARESLNESLLLLQTFTAVVAVTFLVLGAAVAELRQAQEEVRQANVELERRVLQRTAELGAVNRELEAFSFSVSHDLQAPLRSIDGFSLELLEDSGDRLDMGAKDTLERIRRACRRMRVLIKGLLEFSRVTRGEMRLDKVDLSGMARAVGAELSRSQPDRQVDFVVADGLLADGDEQLLRVVMQNLLENAWKFTGKRPRARVEFGAFERNSERIYLVRDDGAGFDGLYADQLFGPFQRLHSETEFPGTGIGLATVQRIIHRHGGRVWAEGAVDRGATIYFTLASGRSSVAS